MTSRTIFAVVQPSSSPTSPFRALGKWLLASGTIAMYRDNWPFLITSAANTDGVATNRMRDASQFREPFIAS